MSAPSIRRATDDDFAAIVALNAQQVQHTSEMDMARLQALASLAWSLRVVEFEGQTRAEIAGFVLAMRRGCGYANANFEWFERRCSDFVYIDRVVVGPRFQGRALGAGLYQDLFARVAAAGIDRVTCEYNVVPENLPSQAFHARMGFEEICRQWLGTDKQVSMQQRRL
ncbi:MAG TPA: GNAT family N-acetyltransferase [Stenotrophomonas sp.]|jgi:predicted GNAT superfamily acetyltransferase